jgi:hypothetical protein
VGPDFSRASITGVQGKGCSLTSLNCLNSCNASYMIGIMRILYYCVSWEILLCEHCLRAVKILLRESYQQVGEILLLWEHYQWARNLFTMWMLPTGRETNTNSMWMLLTSRRNNIIIWICPSGEYD